MGATAKGLHRKLVSRITGAISEVEDDPERPYREPSVWVHLG